MQITKFNGKKWLIDLEWEILPIDSEDSLSRRGTIKALSNKVDMTYGVFIEFENQEAIGFSKKKVKAPSASYYLALANQRANVNMSTYTREDWIVIEDVGDDRYWMGVINQGVPSPQFDKLLDLTTIKDQVVDLVNSSESYKIFSTSEYISQIFSGIQVVENQSINDLTADVIKEKMKFEKLRGIPTVVLVGASSVVALIACVFAAQSIYESHAMQKRIEERNRQQALAKERAEQNYQSQLMEYQKELEKKEMEAKQEVISGLAGKPSNILNAWYTAVGGNHIGISGWNITNINCYFNVTSPDDASKSNCDIYLERTGLSTNRMLLQEFPDANINGNGAVVSRRLIADSSIYDKPEQEVLDALPNIKNWGFDMLSQLQLMKIVDIDYEITASEDIKIMPPLKPLSPSEIERNIKQSPSVPTSVGIAKGDLIITGKNFDLLRELADNVDFSFVGVKSVNFDMTGNLGEIPWTVNMNYFLRTDEGGMVGSDSYGLSNSSVPTEGDEGEMRGQ